MVVLGDAIIGLVTVWNRHIGLQLARGSRNLVFREILGEAKMLFE